MTKVYDERTNANLAAAVEAVNKVNWAANVFAIEARKAFAPMVGKKVCCVDGSLTKRAKAIRPEAVDGCQVFTDPAASGRILWFVVRGHVTGHHAQYHSASVKIGHLDQFGVLVSLTDAPDAGRRHDYTVEGVKACIQAVDDAEGELSKARMKLAPFERNYY